MTPSQAQTAHESVKETLKLNEKKITDATPGNFTAFVNVSDISPPFADDTPPSPSTSKSPSASTTTPLVTTTPVPLWSSTSFKQPEYNKQGMLLLFLTDSSLINKKGSKELRKQ